MKNLQMEVVDGGKTLVIKVDLTKRLGKSKSGKTEMIATSEGNITVPGGPDAVKLGLNIYL